MVYIYNPIKNGQVVVGSKNFQKMLRQIVNNSFSTSGWTERQFRGLDNLRAGDHMRAFKTAKTERRREGAIKAVATKRAQGTLTKAAQAAAVTRKANLQAEEERLQAQLRKVQAELAKVKENRRLGAQKAKQTRAAKKANIEPVISVGIITVKGIQYDCETFKWNPKYKIDGPKKIEQFFAGTIDKASKTLERGDKLQLTVQCPQFYKGYFNTKVVPVDDFNKDLLLEYIMLQLQSAEVMAIDSSIVIEVKRYRALRGGAFNKHHDYLGATKKGSVIKVNNTGNDCGARAFLIGEAYITMDITSNDCIYILKQRKSLDELVNQLYQDIDLPKDTKLTHTDLGKIVTLKKRNIVIVDMNNGGMCYLITGVYDEIYDFEKTEPVSILLYKGHYDCITKINAFFASSYFCYKCMKGYKDDTKHKCTKDTSGACKMCHRKTCQKGDDDDIVQCPDCNVYYYDGDCYLNHLKVRCSRQWKCSVNGGCGRILNRTILPVDENGAPIHSCSDHYCVNCDCYVPPDHRCFMTKKDAKPHVEDIIAFDFETFTDEKGRHNFRCADAKVVCTSSCTSVCECNEHHWFWEFEDFYDFIFAHEGFTFIAHNGKGYDFHFIFRYFTSRGITPEYVTVGSKIILMSIPRFGIRFIDSMSFMAMSLAKIPELFGLEKHVRKGYFPHFFKGDLEYVGPYPPIEAYGFDSYPVEKRGSARRWYYQLVRDKAVFNYKEEMIAYCKNDVDVLASGIKRFKEMFLVATNNTVDPWSYSTIASACMATYRSSFMPENSIPIHHEDHYQRHSAKGIKWLEFLRARGVKDMQHALRWGEKWIERDCGKKYYVDGFSKRTNTVYEFNGCEFHGCPKCKDPEDFNHRRIQYEQLWRYTEAKKAELIALGYNYVSMSECEFDRSKVFSDFKIERLDLDEVIKLDPRDAFFGGRTNASKLYYKCTRKRERVKYCDFTSLYPYINAYGLYPCYSHPEKITYDFDMTLNYEGFIKCKVLAPRNLYHPVLPAKINGKTMFTLCQRCAENGLSKCLHNDNDRSFTGTWCIPEVKLALEKGYKIIKTYEIWKFEKSAFDLFKGYVMNFLKTKQEASGYPKWCKTDADRTKYISEYEKEQGILLNRDNILRNEGLRSVAKIMLNSLWGKFGQKNNQRKHKIINVENDPQSYYDIMFNEKYVVHDVLHYNDTFDLSYSLTKHAVKTDNNTSIYIAAYTTALARCKLYSVLDKVGEKVIYYDTDSIIYVDEDNDIEETLPYGDYLGDLTDELKGDNIVEFVSGGPKNYSYITESGKCKTVCKGFALSYENSLKLGHVEMKDIVFGNLDNVHLDFSEIKVSSNHVVSNKRRTIVPEGTGYFFETVQVCLRQAGCLRFYF